ncbi:MAG: hypothetical protein ACYSTX_03615 [Planctomycetota bacterium]|jgi:hypothetical protein
MRKEVIQSVFVSLAALSLICNSCIENTPAQFSVDREFVSNADRVVSVGFAYDGKSIKDFIKAVDLANKELLEYGIFLDIRQAVEVDLPRSFDVGGFQYGIKYSFFHTHEYYFVWTSSDYHDRDDKDYTAKAFTEYGICLIDDDWPENSLQKLITQEILRAFINAENSIVYNENDRKYFSQVDKQKVRENLHKKFPMHDYESNTNLKSNRTVEVNIALDGVSRALAQQLISEVSQLYTNEFNISMVVVGMYDYNLSDNWETDEQMSVIKKMVENKSDIYMLFTSRNWRNENDLLFSSITAEAYRDSGYIYLETCYGENTTNILIHEFAHLFKARHIYRKDAVMHPHNRDNPFWTQKTRQVILENKFRSWN